MVEQRIENPCVNSSSLFLNIVLYAGVTKMKKNLKNSLINIKNAQISKKSVIFLKKSKKLEILLKLLWSENFILGYKLINKKNIKVFLKYLNNKPLIKFLKFVKTTTDLYFSKKKIWKINDKSFFFLFSTSSGFKFLNDCKKTNVGGALFLILK